MDTDGKRWDMVNALNAISLPKTARRLLPGSNLIHRDRSYTTDQCSYNRSDRSYSYSDSLVSALISAIRFSCSVYCTQSLHCRVIKSLHYSHGFLGDHLVSSYVKLGCSKDAHHLFDELPVRDLVSWNSFISGFSHRGELAVCLQGLFRMKLEFGFAPNEVTVITLISGCSDVGASDVGKYVHGFAVRLGILVSEIKVSHALINLYGKSGEMDAACRLFEEMPSRNLVSWNSIISVHVQKDLALEGLKYFIMMRRQALVCDEATFLSLLQTCEKLGVRKLAESIHGYMMICGFCSSLTVSTALLTLYAKLGVLSDSCKVFDEIINPDAVAWTAKLAAYSVHGRGREAVETFKSMVKKGAVPDHVTFTHLLSACSHSGLVNEGKHYFSIMSNVHGVEPRLDHYSCMVDLLGRSGLLNGAYNLVKGMPIEPNAGVWGALIGACRVYGNIELGKEAAENLFALDPSDARNYIMLSNIYSAAGRWKEAAEMRTTMNDMNLIRHPGCSFIEHDNKLHRFVVDDHSHPDLELINAKLEELIGRIRLAGFKSRTEFVLHDIGEELKEGMINKHSEKLAIAFGLLVNKKDMPIVITKNLRICGDCHSFAKFVSLIEKRNIVIRDKKRFHHFVDGLCSCEDYW